MLRLGSILKPIDIGDWKWGDSSIAVLLILPGKQLEKENSGYFSIKGEEFEDLTFVAQIHDMRGSG